MENIKSITPEEEPTSISLFEYWKIFWKKKYYLIVPIVVALVIASIGVRYLTPIYESTTLLSVEDKSMLAQTVGKYIPSVEERSRMRNRQYRAMIETKVKSRAFLELIIKDLGLDRSPRIRKLFANSSEGLNGVSLDERIERHLVEALREKISVSSPTPGFFKISVFDTDPITSYVLAKKISEKFIETTREAQIKGIRQAGAFSDEQLAIYKEKLEESEKELARIKKEMMQSDIESNPVNASNLHYCEALKRSLNAEIERKNLSLKRLREKLVAIFGLVPTTDKIAKDESVKNSERRLMAFGEEKLLSELSEGRDVPDSEEFKKATESLRQRIMEIIRKEYGQFSPDLHSLITEYFYQRYLLDYLKFQKNKLDSFTEQFNKNMERKPYLEKEFNRVSHEVETNRTIYQAFLESKTSAQISEAVQSTNLGMRINIIEQPQKPLVPVKPNKIKIMLLALIFAGACGLASIVATEYFDDSFRSIEEVEKMMKLPVLGTVPKMASGFEWEKKKRGRMILIWTIGLVIFIGIISGVLYVYSSHLKSAGIGIELKDR